MADTYLIECPDCGLRIEIEKKTGKIVNTFKKPAFSDKSDPFKEILKENEKKKKELENYFGNIKEGMEKRKKELEKTFEENKKKAKDDPSKPINPMDLD